MWYSDYSGLTSILEVIGWPQWPPLAYNLRSDLKFGFSIPRNLGVIPYRIYKKGHFWKWLSLIWIKFGTIVGLYEKLPNTKFEANPTSMSRVMAIWNFGLEAKISKIGLIQEAIAPSILKISSKFQRILVRIFKAHFFCFEVILISQFSRPPRGL